MARVQAQQIWNGWGGEARRRGAGAVLGMLVAAAVGLAGCASTQGRRSEGPPVPVQVRAGLELYEAQEFALAAHRFAEAADEAERCGEPVVERRVRAAECTSWLRARQLGRFSGCTARLEELQRQGGRPDAGVNTLIALGSVAGSRPLPPLRLPNAVYGVVHAVAGEGR